MAWAGYADPGARIRRRARGTRRHDVPVVTALARRPVSHPLRAPPNPATRQGHKDLFGPSLKLLERIARHPWRNVSESRTPARTSMSERSSRCDLPLASRSFLPLHPRRSSACAQGMAGHGRPAKACHDRDVVSGRPRAQALRRDPARQGRRGCGVPSLWFLSLGKQRKGPAPGRMLRSELRASQVRNHERRWLFEQSKLKPDRQGFRALKQFTVD